MKQIPIIKNRKQYIKVLCLNEAIDQEEYSNYINDNRYETIVIDANWDMAGRYRIVLHIIETIDDTSDSS